MLYATLTQHRFYQISPPYVRYAQTTSAAQLCLFLLECREFVVLLFIIVYARIVVLLEEAEGCL